MLFGMIKLITKHNRWAFSLMDVLNALLACPFWPSYSESWSALMPHRSRIKYDILTVTKTYFALTSFLAMVCVGAKIETYLSSSKRESHRVFVFSTSFCTMTLQNGEILQVSFFLLLLLFLLLYSSYAFGARSWRYRKHH